ncbi:MAG TPA: prolipoprotein diacylglyceryl transferase [bacterium]|nr:prolipoprotein diacylglyceryl transferase [bacterium]
MRPTLLRIGDLTLSGYYTLAVLGVVIGFFILDREAKRTGLDRRIAFNAGVYAAIFGYLGARIQHIIFDGFFEIYLQKPIAMLYFWKGGLAFYGAIVLGSAAIVFYLVAAGRPVVRYLDLFTLPCALGLVLGRIGCYLNGCCFGKISAGPLGAEFIKNGLSAKKQFTDTMIGSLNDVPYPVIQTQLIEAFFGFLLFLFLFFIRRRVTKPGVMFGGWLIGYAVVRFIVEIFRDDDRGLFFGGLLSTSQIIALFTVVLGALLWYLPAEEEKKPAVTTPSEGPR